MGERISDYEFYIRLPNGSIRTLDIQSADISFNIDEIPSIDATFRFWKTYNAYPTICDTDPEPVEELDSEELDDFLNSFFVMKSQELQERRCEK